jgi:carboxymethylenebutenolidase
MGETIVVQAEGGKFSAYVVRPQQSRSAAVVVLHEIFGVNGDIRHTCKEIAQAGFFAIAPELFWRQEHGVDLNTWSDEEWKKGLALYTAFDRDLGVRDVVATLNAGRRLDGATGKVGVVGFCLGGLMTYLTAARHEVDVAIAYHGADTERYLEEAHAIHAPLLMHLAEEDEFITKTAQADIKAALANVPNAKVYSYPGQNHGFARHTGLHYNAKAAAMANGRSIEFLTEYLS